MPAQSLQGGRYCDGRAKIPPHYINGNTIGRSQTGSLIVVAQIQYFLAFVEAVCSHVVTKMDFARGFVHGQRWRRQRIMTATLVAPRTGLFVLLNGHANFSCLCSLLSGCCVCQSGFCCGSDFKRASIANGFCERSSDTASDASFNSSSFCRAIESASH